MWLWAPILNDPPLCTLRELETVYSLPRLCEMHRIMEYQADLDRAQDQNQN